jgi:hypothetical protein
MNYQNSITTPLKQFPLRLEQELADELDSISVDMNVIKTKISQIAIRKFLNELKQLGARKYFKEMCEV